jgi:hypothetical protein
MPSCWINWNPYLAIRTGTSCSHFSAGAEGEGFDLGVQRANDACCSHGCGVADSVFKPGLGARTTQQRTAVRASAAFLRSPGTD